jgi:DNA polymerase-3 subunit epsilon
MPDGWGPLPWYLNLLTAFDLESTGIDTRNDRIVTGYVATTLGPDIPGWCVVPGASVVIDPGVPIPKGASDTHGITDEYVRAKGMSPADGVNGIAEALARSLKARIPVVGFNLACDFALLHWECIRHGLPTVAERVGRARDAMVGPVIDAYVLDRHVEPYRRGKRKLDVVATGVYGVPEWPAHAADGDAHAAALMARVIGGLYPDLGALSAVDLHLQQKVWRAAQQRELQSYFRTMKGQPDAYCDPCWPYCVDLTHLTG